MLCRMLCRMGASQINTMGAIHSTTGATNSSKGATNNSMGATNSRDFHFQLTVGASINRDTSPSMLRQMGVSRSSAMGFNHSTMWAVNAREIYLLHRQN